jgi:Fic-DOC domain mobile mystery protein B
MGLDLNYNHGQTPLDEDEKEDLLIASITTREELDEFEQQNIEEAIEWTISKTQDLNSILTEKFIRELHKKMFGNVWKWAGQFRKTNKNIGVHKEQIPVELRKLLDDANFWIENKTFSPDELVLRFKHRLVSIHCFANGNGRHSRLIADVIIKDVFDLPYFSWSGKNLVHPGEARKSYLYALKDADKGSYNKLIKFSRS